MPSGQESIQTFVEGTIANHKIVVFSKSNCPFCGKTKTYFSSRYPREAVKVVELDDRNDGSEIQDYLRDKTGARSVPRVFINGESIGGNDDLHRKPEIEVAALIGQARA